MERPRGEAELAKCVQTEPEWPSNPGLQWQEGRQVRSRESVNMNQWFEIPGE